MDLDDALAAGAAYALFRHGQDRQTRDINQILEDLASREVDPEQVLAAAKRSARVLEFSYGPPTLAELFLELVAP